LPGVTYWVLAFISDFHRSVSFKAGLTLNTPPKTHAALLASIRRMLI
jgi:hypothetical protein